MTAHERSGPAGAARSEASRNDVALIVFLLAAITALHLFTTASPETMAMHLLYRKLYYIPIIYAGFVFGWRGGLVTALATALVFGPHAQSAMGGLVGPNVDNLYEIVMFIAVGFLFGWLRDLEERKARDLRTVSVELEHAYHTLEERAIQLCHHPAVHAGDPPVHHVRRDHGGPGWVGRHRQHRCGARTRHE